MKVNEARKNRLQLTPCLKQLLFFELNIYMKHEYHIYQHFIYN